MEVKKEGLLQISHNSGLNSELGLKTAAANKEIGS